MRRQYRLELELIPTPDSWSGQGLVLDWITGFQEFLFPLTSHHHFIYRLQKDRIFVTDRVSMAADHRYPWGKTVSKRAKPIQRAQVDWHVFFFLHLTWANIDLSLNLFQTLRNYDRAWKQYSEWDEHIKNSIVCVPLKCANANVNMLQKIYIIP